MAIQNQAATPAASGEDEIDLITLWNVLVRRRRWILACLVLCLAAAGAYLLVKTPVYEASVKVRIGQVASAGPFEAPELISSRLLSEYGEDVADGVKRPRPFLKRASAPKGLATVVELVTEGDAPADAVALLEKISNDVQAAHQQNYALNVKYLTERIEHLDIQRKTLTQQLADATALMEQVKQRDPVQASLIMLERGRLAIAINALDAERPALAQRLSPPQTQATELLGSIAAPAKPAAPKKSFILALAVVLGLMGGTILAFAVEFVANARSSTGGSKETMPA
ncbi:Wzz/FepE/Etk N-terminal domain-containing protein [Thauera sinica]|uniref:Wzz/FepE/Etk N-terminal domain-containing protein n=1 Tax=Thauera sinica TaxID=2665146 RepID=A0ABW1APL1_9RHOO|nr:Wzz/FepE/Etk N-terminal domain-containing protein [Thauera sp. K11]ATE62276.1 hypothetical protein CCZ27_21890 [Thauera sp. K11]